MTVGRFERFSFQFSRHNYSHLCNAKCIRAWYSITLNTFASLFNKAAQLHPSHLPPLQNSKPPGTKTRQPPVHNLQKVMFIIDLSFLLLCRKQTLQNFVYVWTIYTWTKTVPRIVFTTSFPFEGLKIVCSPTKVFWFENSIMLSSCSFNWNNFYFASFYV